jgi:hypothetical protein
MIKVTLTILVALTSFPSFATETIDCGNEEYSVLIHVGHQYGVDDHGNVISSRRSIADFILYKNNEQILVSSKFESDINLHESKRESNVNTWLLITDADNNIEIEISNEISRLSINGSSYSVSCEWEM